MRLTAKDRTTAAELVELAARHGLELVADTMRVEEAGLDYRVVFARSADGEDWVLRVPRRPDVSARIADERRILGFVRPRLSVAVPSFEVCSEELIAYRRLPGEPGLTLDVSGQPVWHVEPDSRDFAAALGRLIAELHALDAAAAVAAGVVATTMSDARAKWRADLDAVRAEMTIAPALRERWEAWLDDDALWPEPTTFTHGELYAAHVLLETPARIVGVLDWTTAKVGDPAVDFTYQHMMGAAPFAATVEAYVAAGGRDHAHLAERCAAIATAAPLAYAVFALQSRDPRHLATAAGQLAPEAP